MNHLEAAAIKAVKETVDFQTKVYGLPRDPAIAAFDAQIALLDKIAAHASGEPMNDRQAEGARLYKGGVELEDIPVGEADLRAGWWMGVGQAAEVLS